MRYVSHQSYNSCRLSFFNFVKDTREFYYIDVKESTKVNCKKLSKVVL